MHIGDKRKEKFVTLKEMLNNELTFNIWIAKDAVKIILFRRLK